MPQCKKFWFASFVAERKSESIDPRDDQLYAVLRTELNFGLRIDDISTLTMQHLTVEGGQIRFTIARLKKNSTG